MAGTAANLVKGGASEMAVLLRAAQFSAIRHQRQRRKGADAHPYINHPLHVATLLAHEARVDDVNVLVAALLHDTVEDTETTLHELRTEFGDIVAGLVDEVSDDKSLPKAERKALQIAHASNVSLGAKLIKIADKISNVNDVVENPPTWTRERKVAYMDWALLVVNEMRGAHPGLEALFDRTLARARLAVCES